MKLIERTVIVSIADTNNLAEEDLEDMVDSVDEAMDKAVEGLRNLLSDINLQLSVDSE